MSSAPLNNAAASTMSDLYIAGSGTHPFFSSYRFDVGCQRVQSNLPCPLMTIWTDFYYCLFVRQTYWDQNKDHMYYWYALKIRPAMLAWCFFVDFFPLLVFVKNNAWNSTLLLAVGPKTQSVEMLGKLVAAGMNVCRMNFSHGSHEVSLRRLMFMRNQCFPAPYLPIPHSFCPSTISRP